VDEVVVPPGALTFMVGVKEAGPVPLGVDANTGEVPKEGEREGDVVNAGEIPKEGEWEGVAMSTEIPKEGVFELDKDGEEVPKNGDLLNEGVFEADGDLLNERLAVLEADGDLLNEGVFEPDGVFETDGDVEGRQGTITMEVLARVTAPFPPRARPFMEVPVPKETLARAKMVPSK